MLKPVAFMFLRDAVRSEILHILREWPRPSSITVMLHKTAGRFCHRCVRSFAVPHLLANMQPSLIPYESSDRRADAAALAACPSGAVLNMATPTSPPAENSS